MLRPALRTSHSSACGPGSGISTTLPGRPRSPISSTRRARSRSCVLALLARELDQQDRLGLADQGALDHRPEGGIGARQLDHGAIDQLDRGRLQLDDVLRRCPSPCRSWGSSPRPASCAWAAARASGVSRSVTASVPSLPTSRCARFTELSSRVGPLRLREEDVEVVAARPGAAPWGTCARSRRARRRPAPPPCRRWRAPPAACPRAAPSRSARAGRRPGWRRSPATLCTMLP